MSEVQVERPKVEQTRIRDAYTPIDAGLKVNHEGVTVAFIIDGRRYAFRCDVAEMENIHVYAKHWIPKVTFNILEGGLGQ